MARVLSHTSKISERIVFNQINLFFESRFSPLLTGFRKNHSTQSALVNIIEKWKHGLDKGKKVGTISVDISKAFDTLNHNLLFAKLNVYGFSFNATKFIQNYLSERFQRVNINSNFREWRKILLAVPQGSILGPFIYHFHKLHFLFYRRRLYLQLGLIEDDFKEVKTKLKKNFKLL